MNVDRDLTEPGLLSGSCSPASRAAPMAVSVMVACYEETVSLTINGGTLWTGRAELAATARSYVDAFPDLNVSHLARLCDIANALGITVSGTRSGGWSLLLA